MPIDKKHWMDRTFSRNKGALHRQLGVPEGETIPMWKLRDAVAAGGLKAKRAQPVINAIMANRKNRR